MPTEVSDAITQLIADAGAYGLAFIGLAAAAASAKIGIKWVKGFISRAT
jgi:hypothetical protein